MSDEAIILRDDDLSTLDHLNDRLSQGWNVTATCAMPSSRSAYSGQYGTQACQETPPTCLVVIRKNLP